MNSDQLIKFKAIAEHKTMTEAAESLYLSQPALSLMVKAMEDELGCELLTRDKKNIYINPNGKRLLEYAEPIIDLINQIDYAFHNEEHINLAGTNVTTAFMLMKYPKEKLMNVTIHNCNEYDMPSLLKKGELDIIACNDHYVKREIEPSELERILLCREQLGLYVPKGHKFYKRKSIKYSELVGEPLCCRTDFPSQNLWIENIEKITGYKFNLAFNMDRYTYECLRDNIDCPEIRMLTSIYNVKENYNPEDLSNYRFVRLDGTYSSRYIYVYYLKRNARKVTPILESLKAFYTSNNDMVRHPRNFK